MRLSEFWVMRRLVLAMTNSGMRRFWFIFFPRVAFVFIVLTLLIGSPYVALLRVLLAPFAPLLFLENFLIFSPHPLSDLAAQYLDHDVAGHCHAHAFFRPVVGKKHIAPPFFFLPLPLVFPLLFV